METDNDLDSINKPGTQPINRRIMWVEDDVFLSDIIARKCKSNRCELLHTTNADDTFTILKNDTPDVIILDILLPGKNGYEILEELKKNDATKNIPVIILSNFGQKEEIEKGIKLGAEKYLIKATLTLDEILSEVNTVLVKNDSKNV
jgi:DNA-binding response OmpR family regulator